MVSKKTYRLVDIKEYLALKGTTRCCIVRTKGQIINDLTGNVGYSDYNLNYQRKTSCRFKQLPITPQIRLISKLNSTYNMDGNDIYVMNPVSGQMEKEQDTRTGYSASAQAYPSNTGIPVVVTNPFTDPVPVQNIIPTENEKMKDDF